MTHEWCSQTVPVIGDLTRMSSVSSGFVGGASGSIGSGSGESDRQTESLEIENRTRFRQRQTQSVLKMLRDKKTERVEEASLSGDRYGTLRGPVRRQDSSGSGGGLMAFDGGSRTPTLHRLSPIVQANGQGERRGETGDACRTVV